MSKIRNLISALLGLLALAGLAVGLTWLLGPRGVRPAQQESPVRTPTPGPVETPTIEPTKRSIPTPDETGLIRETPIPTYQPPPTPTPRPWPVGTPFPIPSPAEDPSGTILYITYDDSEEERGHRECTVYAIQVDKTGRSVSEPNALTSVENCGGAFASPDSRYLAVLRGCGDAGVHPAILDVKTLEMWPLFGSDCAAFGLFHGWHPDSKHVLFGVDGFSSDFQFEEGQSWRDAGLWLVDIETGEYSVLAGEWVSGGAAVSPDGTRVVYGDGDEAWVVSLNGAQREQLDAPIGYVREWSPDGKWVLSTGDGVGAVNVSDGRQIQLDPDVTRRREGSLPPLPGDVILADTLAAWSPDGRTVAVTQMMIPKGGADFDPFEAGNIYLLDAAGGHKRPLLPEGHCLSAAWSPDGSMLAFICDRSGSRQVWVANADGSGLRQLTHEGPTRQFSIYYAPVWIPREVGK